LVSRLPTFSGSVRFGNSGTGFSGRATRSWNRARSPASFWAQPGRLAIMASKWHTRASPAQGVEGAAFKWPNARPHCEFKEERGSWPK
jgi:hypothetical protein